jgi:lipopolysaccharide O-acetyltransferase
MNELVKITAHIFSIPARIKGMKFGKNSFIGPGYDWMFVNLRGIELGDNVVIGRNAWFETSVQNGKQSKIVIGDGTHLGRNMLVAAIKKITIGKKCLISNNIFILDHDHDLSDVKVSPMDSAFSKPEEIIIDDHCFIGAHSFILKGVHLGKHCVVGANSVVTKSFPAYSVVAGNPARLIKKLK